MKFLPGPRIVAAILFALLLGTALARPETPAGRSWPTFGGSINRNPVNTTEKNVVSTWSTAKGKEKNVKWAAQLGTTSYGGPTIAGGRIFVGTNNDRPRDPAVKGDKGVLMCFRESDGKFLWQAVHDKLEDGEVNDFPKQGIISTPAVDGDQVYYVSNRCELVCADAAGDEKSGKAKILWTLDMVKELKVFPCQASASSPLVLDDLVYVVPGNGVDIGKNNRPVENPKAPSFLAVDKKTGKVAWQSNAPGDRIMDGQWSNPVAAEVNGKKQVIFPGGDGWLYAFEAKKGELLWKFDCNPKAATPYKAGGTGQKGFFIATPVVWENKVYVGIGQEPDDGPGVGHLWCIDVTKEPKNKDKDLSPVKDNFDPKAPANKESGLVWHYGGEIMPKPADGREYVFGRTLSTCSVADGLVYAAELEGFLHCLDARTGKKYWEHDFLSSTWNAPTVIDGKVFMGVDGGKVFVFPAGKDKKAPTKIEGMNGDLKVPPVAVNGVLYVMTPTHLYALAAKLQ